MSIEKAKAYLRQFGAEDRVIEFPVSSATVELAAEAAHCEPARIAKTLSFRTNDGVILIVAAGDTKIDNPKYKTRFGCKARMLAFEEVELEIDPKDLRIDTFRSSGAGGQHINKTSSAVRLIHRPTGIVVACQEERSQFQNRERCMMMLSSKLYQLEQERIESAVSSERRSQVGSGMRNEKIRTYNFPQSRVTDHRIGLTLYQLDSILNGGLDPILDALIAADQAEKLRRSESSDKS